MNEKSRCCCFLGHRKISDKDELKEPLYTTIRNLIINKNVDTFLFGSKSQFDDLCYVIVTELKKDFPHIQRIYVRAEFPYIDDSYRNYLLERFEHTYYPQNIFSAGKAVYVERNYEMINKSKYCVIYYDSNYTPSTKRHKNNFLTKKTKSGTKLAYDYAIKKCVVINIKNKQ